MKNDLHGTRSISEGLHQAALLFEGSRLPLGELPEHFLYWNHQPPTRAFASSEQVVLKIKIEIL